MADLDFLRRIEMLESTVETLRALPGDMRQLSGRVDRLEWQFVQLRTEMRDGFSAIRRDFATKDDLVAFATKEDLSAGLDSLREELHGDIAGAARELSGAIAETRQELGETRREVVETRQELVEIRQELVRTRQDLAAQTRMLFEDVISRLKVLGEGRS